jgi:hypothetical protein
LADIPVVPTPALAAGTVAAAEIGAIATGFTGEPQIFPSTQGTLHWDTSPSAISTPGSPAVVAAPVRSAFQQMHLLLKLIVRCAWCVRGSGFVQVVNNTTW